MSNSSVESKMNRPKRQRIKRTDVNPTRVLSNTISKPPKRSKDKQKCMARLSLGNTKDAKNSSSDRPLLSSSDETERETSMNIEEIHHTINKQSSSRQDDEPNSPVTLIDAAASGCIEKLKSLIQNGTNVNEKDDDENTALMKAAQGGHLECVDLLIRNGAEMNHSNKHKQQALTFACKSGSLPCVKRLVEAGAKINTLSKSGLVLLQAAMDSGHWEIFKFLTESNYFSKGNLVKAMYESIDKKKGEPLQIIANHLGPDHINKSLLQSYTPLEYSAINNFPEGAPILMAAGTDANFQGREAFFLACQFNRKEFIEQLLPYLPTLDFQSYKGCTALLTATEKGHKDTVELLLKAGASVELPDNMGITPLLCACINRHRSIVELLLSAGSNIHHRDHIHGDTALIWASKNNDVSLVKFLLECGANIETEDKYGNTALCIACEQDCFDVVKVLVESGANIEHTNSLGCSPVMLAADGQSQMSLAYLISLNVNLNRRDVHGKTAIMLASKFRNVSGLWLERNSTSYLNCFKLLLEAGADTEVKDNYGMTVLEETILYINDHRNVRFIEGGAYIRLHRMRLLLSYMIAKGVYLGRKFHRLILLGRDYFGGAASISLIDALQKCSVQPSLETFDGDETLVHVGYLRNKDRKLTPLHCAFFGRRPDLILYFVDNLFLHWFDVFPITAKYLYTAVSMYPYADELYSQPWTLRSLSFIKVSTCLGFGCSRKSRVEASGLPPGLQRLLLFEQLKTKRPDEGVERKWSAVHG